MRFIEECTNSRIRVLNTASSNRFDFFNLKICLTPRYITCLPTTYRAIDSKITDAFPKLGMRSIVGNSAVFERFGLTRREAVDKMIDIAYQLYPRPMTGFDRNYIIQHQIHNGSFPDRILDTVLNTSQNRMVLQEFLLYLISLVEDKLTLSNQIVFNKKTVVIL